MINGFISAVRTLTRIPIRGKESENFASSLPWFPFVGFLLASLLSGIIIVFNEVTNHTWNEATAIIVILAGTLLTGALHLDGFADWADSLGALHNKEKMLRIMKDSNSGAFGVVALIFLLLAKWIAVVKLLELNIAITGIFIAYISSRFAMVYLSVSLPYSRVEGGTGEQIVKGATKKHLILALVGSLVLLFLIGNLSSIVFFVAGFLVALLWKSWCQKHLGGITGDLLGAGSEFVEVTLLFLIALFYNPLNTIINKLLNNI